MYARTAVKSITRNSKHRKNSKSCFFYATLRPLHADGKRIFVGRILFFCYYYYYYFYFFSYVLQCRVARVEGN